jgi:hypothetical protein
MSNRRKKKRSPAKAVIGAALEIAREHAELIAAANPNTDPNIATIPVPTAVTK